MSHFELLDERLSTHAGEGLPTREGLPASYRMRHDEHYVDHVMAQPVAKPVRLVPIQSIAAPERSRSRDLAPLAASIRLVGVLQPLLVRSLGDERFELIAGANRLAAAEQAGLTEVPCFVHDVDESQAKEITEAERLGAEEERHATPTPTASALLLTLRDLAERVGGIEACISLMAARERPTRERVALDLMRIETQRCAWLAQALAVLAEEPFLVRTEFAASALLERSLAQLDVERRLAGAEIAVEIARPPLMIWGDHRLLTVALAVAGAAVLSIAMRADGARLRARVQPDAGRSAALFEIAQDQVSMPEWALARFFDPDWPDRPGGALLGPALVGARRAAELHGGRFDIGAAPRGGCALTMVVPCG